MELVLGESRYLSSERTASQHRFTAGLDCYASVILELIGEWRRVAMPRPCERPIYDCVAANFLRLARECVGNDNNRNLRRLGALLAGELRLVCALGLFTGGLLKGEAASIITDHVFGEALARSDAAHVKALPTSYELGQFLSGIGIAAADVADAKRRHRAGRDALDVGLPGR